MRFLFATTRGAGHVGPLVPFARAAVAAGPRGPRRRPRLRRTPSCGAPGLPFARGRRAAGRARGAGVGAGLVAGDLARAWRASCRTCSSGCTRGWRCRRCSRWSRRGGPDVVVRETLEFSSALAAERHGVPQVRVGIHLDSRTDADARLLGVAVPALDALRPRIGLGAGPPRPPRSASSPVLTLAPASTSGAAEDTPVLRFRDAAPPPPHDAPDVG